MFTIKKNSTLYATTFDSSSDNECGTGNEFDNTHTDEDTTKPKSSTKELVFILLFMCLLKHNVDVPPIVYLFLKTLAPNSITKFDINDGKIANLPIYDNITYIFKKLVSITSNCLSINVNNDGLPLFCSSYKLRPTLTTVNSMLTPVPVAVYCDFGNPNLNEFVQTFCEKLSSLLLNGVSYNGVCLC